VFIESNDDGGGGDNWITGAISCAKLQSYHHHKQTNIQFFTGGMPFLSPNQQCQSIEGENITFHGLGYPKLTWGLPTLSLNTNSSWLPWGRVAMPHQSSDANTPNFTSLCRIVNVHWSDKISNKDLWIKLTNSWYWAR